MSQPNLLSTMAELAAWRARRPLRPNSVRGLKRGGGQPILVLPGLLGTDRQTRRFRDGLQMLDYQPLTWEMGQNRGPTPAGLEKLADRVSKLALAHGRLRVVGFGMGGLFARWVAQARSAAVSGVVTVNTPFREPLDRAFRRLAPVLRRSAGLDMRGLSFMMRQPPAGDWAAIYSAQDGIVAWHCCMDPAHAHRCFSVDSRHMSCMRNEDVFRQVAECLATFQ